MKKDGRGIILSGIQTTCNRCNANNVFWHKTKNDKWILYGGYNPKPTSNGKFLITAPGNNFHKCK